MQEELEIQREVTAKRCQRKCFAFTTEAEQIAKHCNKKIAYANA